MSPSLLTSIRGFEAGLSSMLSSPQAYSMKDKGFLR